MSPSVQHLLSTFDGLSSPEQHEVVVELLRRRAVVESAPLTDDDLTMVAESLFLQLDAEEADHDSTPSR